MFFCGASRRAYGAVAYLVHQGEASFVESKGRITPIKSQQKEEDRELSIPESKLMAAYLGVLIATNIIAALEPLGIKLRVYLWSDSQIVHHWISKEEGHPRQFITNRVKKIRDFNRTQAATWKYVPSVENPADILSRGASFKELKASKLWKEGPEWLTNRKNWPTWSVTEFKSSRVVHVAVKSADPVVKEEDIFSVMDPSKYSFDMLLRVTAQVFRLASNFRLKNPSHDLWNREPLNSDELQRAEKVWIRAFQKKYFPTELDYLQSKKKSWRPALVSQLDLFLDADRIIRCKGRLQNSTMAESAKYPVLIPKHSDLARLIITDVHKRVVHYGTETTLAKLIQRYWIPPARAQVKRICRNCVKCRRDHGPAYKLPDPAPLPADRIRESYPFEVTGIDFTGAIPVRVKEGEESVYLLLFTCGVTRAIHLEVVESMTSGAFIDALRRFTSRHSIPRVIYSDNASTFVSAFNILTQFFKQSDVAKELANMRIIWKFIPKRAPWYGGWWERLIAVTKISLRKMVGRTRLCLVQLQTVIVQIEAILNDRPLMRVSTDVQSFEPLTPAHLLYGRRITTLPFHYEADEELDDPTYGRDMDTQILSKAYLRTQNVLRTFWRRWSTSYLPSLREHHQATKGPIEEVIKIGDVVQVHQDSKRSGWKLAVVERLNRGADGKVRSVEIRTANGRTSRPINKLYPLEVFELSEKLIQSESKKQSATEAAAEVPSMSTVRDLPENPFVSSIPIPVIDEVSTRPGRIQRLAARQAAENIKIMTRMKTVEEEEE